MAALKPGQHARGGRVWGREQNPAALRVLSSRRSGHRGLDRSAWAQRWRYLLACGWLLVLASAACATKNNPIDELCIKGQLSSAQAAALNPHEYATLPSYCQEATPPGQHGGDAHCQAEALDRVLAAHCSGALK